MTRGHSLGLLAVVALIGFANTARADIADIDLYLGTPASLSGFVVNEIKVDFTNQYSGSQLILNLTAGSVYQNGNVASPYGPPTIAEIGADPLAALDTFVAQGSLTASGASDTPDHVNDPFAANLGSTGPALFDTTGIDIEWFPAGGEVIADQVSFLTGRITLSDDAVGTWEYLASAADSAGAGSKWKWTGVITAGSMGGVLGDTDGNGNVGPADQANFGVGWDPGGSNAGNGIPDGDFNLDGSVGPADQATLGVAWNPAGTDPYPPAPGSGGPGAVVSASAVPEPGSFVLFGLALAAIAVIRKR